MRAIKDKLIFVTSIEFWGDIWYSKHHYAYELSRNNTVYFLNGQRKWKFSNLFSTKKEIKEIKPNLFTVDYKNNFPIVIFKSFFIYLNDVLNSRKLHGIIKANNNKEVIFWQFDPFRFVHVVLPVPFKRIFHVADSYTPLTTDIQIAQRSDLLICVSPDFIDRYKPYSNNIILIPHGVSKDEFDADTEKVKTIKQTYGNFILNIATIFNRIDFDLLERITEEMPHLNFLSIGPVRTLEPDQLKIWEHQFTKKNFFYLERVNGKDLKNFVAASKICVNIEKYDVQLKHLFRGSLKFYNYLAHNKPVVSCLLHDIEDLNNKIVFMTNDNAEYLRLLNLADAGQLEPDHAAVKKFMNEADYSILIGKIALHLYKP